MEYTYNTTVNIEDSVHKKWAEWIQTSFLPDTLTTQLVKTHRVLKVLANENEGHNYAIQLGFENIQDLLNYQNTSHIDFLKQQAELFGEKALSFSTILKEVSKSE